MKGTIIAFLVALCVVATAQDRDPMLPPLQPGDVLLCEGFPKRTVSGTDVTMYQLARLGYASVTAFQQDNGLKVDGVIGPQTKGRAQETYSRTFAHLVPAKTNAPLFLTAEVITNTGMASLSITVSNCCTTPVRIVGMLGTEHDDVLTFSSPALSVRESFCRHNPQSGIVGCGGGSRKTQLCPSNTVVDADSALRCSTIVSRLGPNEDGSVSVELHYLTWDGCSFRDSVRCERPR